MAIGEMIGGRFGEILSGIGESARRTDPSYVAAKAREAELDVIRQEREAQLSEQRKRAMVMDMANAHTLFGQNKPLEATKLLTERKGALTQLGATDMQHTDFMLGLAQNGQYDVLQQELGEALALPGVQEYLPDSMKERNGLASAKSKIYDNGTILAFLPNGGRKLTAPDGREITDPEEARKVLQTARNEEVVHAGAVAQSTATGSGTGSRGQEAINFGLDAARGMPIINRSLQLLESIETGGIDNARMAAKQFFGVESADEAELTANLGKAVLSQLRATFGAAFTAKEGEELKKIEAGLGKSTAGNIRILKQLKRMSERYAKNAIKRAIDTDDFATVDEIRGYMEMSMEPFTPVEGGSPPVDDPLGLLK